MHFVYVPERKPGLGGPALSASSAFSATASVSQKPLRGPTPHKHHWEFFGPPRKNKKTN